MNAVMSRITTLLSRASVIAALGLTIPSVAHADPAAEARARALFEEGRAVVAKGDLAHAAELFTEARAVYPTAGSLYNLAHCEERLGRLAAARQHWAELLGEAKPGDERAVDATAHLAALTERIPTVKLVLPQGAPSGTTMSVDGVEVEPERIGTERTIDPGPHLVVVVAPGRERTSTAVLVAEAVRGFPLRGTLGRELVEAKPASSGPPVAEPPSVAPASEADVDTALEGPRTTLAYVSGGLGLAGLALSGVSALVVLGEKSTVASHCDAEKICDAQGMDAVNGSHTWSALGTVGFVVGVVGVGGFFLLPRGPAAEVAIAPAVGPGLAAVRVTGSW